MFILDKKKTHREACYDVSGECNEFLGLLCLNATGSKTKLCLYTKKDEKLF